MRSSCRACALDVLHSLATYAGRPDRRFSHLSCPCGFSWERRDIVVTDGTRPIAGAIEDGSRWSGERGASSAEEHTSLEISRPADLKAYVPDGRPALSASMLGMVRHPPVTKTGRSHAVSPRCCHPVAKAFGIAAQVGAICGKPFSARRSSSANQPGPAKTFHFWTRFCWASLVVGPL
ncbi:hypothetical protein BD311DRAFT_128002 [Dichomitus squalens]|uniref:Uncharacterized protein n=1 Tax=Dichomitus squalens TaxID=114155 RepID=A0A4Q9M6P6_9APHY|nr:hypothetical protein BD311DRAFT_128002 [Dichomitus squalens]